MADALARIAEALFKFLTVVVQAVVAVLALLFYLTVFVICLAVAAVGGVCWAFGWLWSI